MRDRNVPIAQLTPVSEDLAVNRFKNWKPLKKYAAALDKPVRGQPIEELIWEDRNR